MREAFDQADNRGFGCGVMRVLRMGFERGDECDVNDAPVYNAVGFLRAELVDRGDTDVKRTFDVHSV